MKKDTLYVSSEESNYLQNIRSSYEELIRLKIIHDTYEEFLNKLNDVFSKTYFRCILSSLID